MTHNQNQKKSSHYRSGLQFAVRNGGLGFLRGNVETSFGAMECVEGAREINVRIAAGQTLLGALLRLAGARDINFGWTLGGFGEDSDFIRQDFREPPGNSEALLGGILAINDLADGKFGDQRRVAGQDSQVSVLAGNLHLLGTRLHDFLFRRDDFELE